MDIFGWFVANVHQMLGHDTAAAFIGQPSGSKNDCLLCQYDRAPTDANRVAVVSALSTVNCDHRQTVGSLEEGQERPGPTPATR